MKTVKYLSVCLIGCMMIFGITGCGIIGKQVATFSKDTVDVVSKVSVIKGQYETISLIIKRHQKDFSKEELQEFAQIDTNARMIYSKIQNITDIKHFDVNPDEVKYLYEVAKDSYTRAKDIISKHQDKFDVYELTKLKMYDIQLQEMNKSVKKMLENPNTQRVRQTLDTILKVTSISLKIILPLVI